MTPSTRDTNQIGRFGITETVKRRRDWIWNPRTREWERVTVSKKRAR